MEKWKRGGQPWEQEQGHGNCPCTVVGRCRGSEGQSTSEPPCLGTERHVQRGQRQHLLTFNFRTVSIWGLRVSCRVSGIRQGWATSGFWGKTGLLPSWETQAHKPHTAPPPSTCCSEGSPSLGGTVPEHLIRGIPQDHLQIFSKHLSSLANSSLPTELGWGRVEAVFAPAQSTGPAGVGARAENPHAQKEQGWTLIPGGSCEMQGPGHQILLIRTALGLDAAGCLLGLRCRRAAG